MEPLQWESVTSSFTAGTIVSGAPARRWKSFFPAYMLSPQGAFSTDKNHIPTSTSGAACCAAAPEEAWESPPAMEHLMLGTLLAGSGALCRQFWSVAEQSFSTYGKRQSPGWRGPRPEAMGQGTAQAQCWAVGVTLLVGGGLPRRVSIHPSVLAVCFVAWCICAAWWLVSPGGDTAHVLPLPQPPQQHSGLLLILRHLQPRVALGHPYHTQQQCNQTPRKDANSTKASVLKKHIEIR